MLGVIHIVCEMKLNGDCLPEKVTCGAWREGAGAHNYYYVVVGGGGGGGLGFGAWLFAAIGSRLSVACHTVFPFPSLTRGLRGVPSVGAEPHVLRCCLRLVMRACVEGSRACAVRATLLVVLPSSSSIAW